MKLTTNFNVDCVERFTLPEPVALCCVDPVVYNVTSHNGNFYTQNVLISKVGLKTWLHIFWITHATRQLGALSKRDYEYKAGNFFIISLLTT